MVNSSFRFPLQFKQKPEATLTLYINCLSCSFQTMFDEIIEYDEYNIDDDEEVNKM